MKITPREKGDTWWGDRKNDLIFLFRAACRLFSRGVIFRRARVSLPWVPGVFSRVRRGASFRRPQRKGHLLLRFD